MKTEQLLGEPVLAHGPGRQLLTEDAVQVAWGIHVLHEHARVAVETERALLVLAAG